MALILQLQLFSALAALKTWDGGAGTANWADANNWNPDGVPTSADAVWLNNSSTNPLPQINAHSGANAATIGLDGVVSGYFLSYAGATPLVLNLYGASVNASNTGPLIYIGSNAESAVSASKVNFRLQTSGVIHVEEGKKLTLNNCIISQSGTRTLTKTGKGTLAFSGSGPDVQNSGGLIMVEGVWDASASTLCLPRSGIISFSNASGVAAIITSANSHNIAGLAGGNSDSEIYATGADGLTITGSGTTSFSGRIRGATKLTYAGGGKLTLNGNNTYIGATVVSNGTLALGPSGSIAGSPALSIAAGAVLDVSAISGGFTLGGGKTISGNGTVSGKLTVASNANVKPGFDGVGTLTVTNGLSLMAGAHLSLDLNSTSNYDAVIVTGGDIYIAGDLAGTTLGYTPAVGDTFYIVRNLGNGTTTGTINGAGDGGKLELNGKWFRVSFTADFGGAGFAVGGTGNDVAIQHINDPSPSRLTVSTLGATNEALVQLRLSWLDNAVGETGYSVYRVWEDGALELLAQLPAGATNFTEYVPNYSRYTYAVQARNGDGTLGDMTYSAPFQAGTSFAQRRDAMLDWLASEVPNLGQFGDGPHRIGRTGFWCATGRLLRGDTNTGISYITTALEDANAEGPNAGFSMWPGMDAYMRWNHLFPESLKNRYREVYVGADAYDNGSTPNQRFMLATASYLANGVWGPEVNSVSSAANGIGSPSGKDFILHILNKTPFFNHEEHDSTHYLQYTLAAIETLAQFAQDAEVRSKARMVVNWALAEAAGYMQNGRWCVSSTRGRASQQQYDYDITGWTWYLIFGGPDPSSFFDSFATAPFLAPQFPTPPPEIFAAGQDRTKSYTRRSLAQRYLGGGDVAYFKQCWMTPGYALWSQVEGDITYNSDGSLNLTDVDAAGIQDAYQGNRWGLAWDDPPWFDSMLTITTPTTYSGTTGGISVWEDTLQHQDTMIAVYNMPPGGGGSTGNNGNWANEWLTGHIPSGYQAITDEATTTGRIFLHYEKLLVAVYLSRPFSWSTNFTVSGVNKAALAIETAPVSEFPQTTAAARLAAFRSAVLANPPNISAISNSPPRFIYTNRHGDVLDLTFGLPGRINGVTVDYSQWPVLEDPWMYQAQNGHLHLFGRNRKITANYYDWSQTTNYYPVAASRPSPTVLSGLSVDVDLAMRVTDVETPGTNLHFSLGTASNGTVILLSNGYTARFTAATNFTGTASFTFNATDNGLHPRLIWHYDFEPPATLSSNSVRDASGAARPATLSFVGTGTSALDSSTPAQLAADSTKSLRLNESGTNAACLKRMVYPSNLSLTNESWTFATWFRRASRTNDDFIFYMGTGDGFSGNGDELQLYLPANSDVLRILHYNSTNGNDLNLTSSATVTNNVWHHAAVTFEKTADRTGTVRLYINGALAGTATNISWALRQDMPIVIGGHASTSASVLSRYFNGWLDDVALFRGALTSNDIARMASQSVAKFGGTQVFGEVNLTVQSGPIPVPVTLITAGAVWKYFDQTNDLGTAWRSNSFNDSAWPAGPAMLGFGDANGLLPATVISSNRQWTTYFRRTFFIPQPSLVRSLAARIMRDDGAVVYLNGVEIWRDTNMPSGIITNQTPAISGLGGTNESTWLTLNLPESTQSLLLTGPNLIAIEVHQNAITSSDLAMDFELTGTVLTTTNTPLLIALEAGNLMLSWPADAGFFSVHTATNLLPPIIWTPLTTQPVLAGNRWRLALPPATNQQRFFRLQTQ